MESSRGLKQVILGLAVVGFSMMMALASLVWAWLAAVSLASSRWSPSLWAWAV